MNNQLKETLLKVADYNELEKEKAARTGNLSFCIMFLMCAVTIVAQILMTGNLSRVIGETIIMLIGGMVYISCAVKEGAWNGSLVKSTPKNDMVTSLICTGIFSILFCLISKKHLTVLQAIGTAACFFAVFSATSYFLLRGLSYLSQKKADKLKD